MGRACAAIAIAILALAPPSTHAQSLQLTTMEVLDQYDRRRELALDALRHIQHFETIQLALEAEGDKWINALGPKEAPRRRLVAATFALEAARFSLDREWRFGAYLVEWGCRELRFEKKPQPEERLWHHAALALIEGARGFEFLGYAISSTGSSPDRHLAHIKGRLPEDDPALVIAHAFQASVSYIQPAPWNLWDSMANSESPETIHGLERALTVPSVAAEAHVRLAFLDLMANRFDSALAHLDSADVLQTDRDIRYLSALFRGWAYMRDHKPDEAMTALRHALEIVPGAQNATLALGAALYSRGDRDEASTLVEKMFALPVQDPWLQYGYWDYRLFPKLIAELREALK